MPAEMPTRSSQRHPRVRRETRAFKHRTRRVTRACDVTFREGKGKHGEAVARGIQRRELVFWESFGRMVCGCPS